MKIISLLGLIMVISLNLFGQANGVLYNLYLKGIYNKNTPTLTCNELYNNYEDYTIVDTRSEEEYKISHLKNALFLNFDTYTKQDLSEIPLDKPIVFYCSVGWRSQKVTEYFIKNGINNVNNLYGGIFDWANKTLPLYNKREQTDSVHVYSQKWGYWLENGFKVY